MHGLFQTFGSKHLVQRCVSQNTKIGKIHTLLHYAVHTYAEFSCTCVMSVLFTTRAPSPTRDRVFLC